MTPQQSLDILNQLRLRVKDAQFSGADHEAFCSAIRILAEAIKATPEQEETKP